MATTSPPEIDASAVQARDWLRIGLGAAAAGIAAVLLAQRLAIAAWPEIALFKPLDSYARSALFVLVPAAGATAAFAWLVRRYADPAPRFIALSLAVLLVSIVPDYLLPTPHRTLLASSVAAVLHAVAALTIVSLLLAGYRRQAAR